MQAFTGKQLFDAFTGIDKSLQRMDKILRRAQLPQWKQRLIVILERIVARLEGVTVQTMNAE